MMVLDAHQAGETYKYALEQIIRYKRTPRAYRHSKFEELIRIAENAIRDAAEATPR